MVEDDGGGKVGGTTATKEVMGAMAATTKIAKGEMAMAKGGCTTYVTRDRGDKIAVGVRTSRRGKGIDNSNRK